VFLPCRAVQSRPNGRVYRAMLRAQEGAVPLRGGLRSLRKTGGKQPLSLRMTKGRNTLPSRRLFYPIRGALTNAQITLTKVPLRLFPTLNAFKNTKTPGHIARSTEWRFLHELKKELKG
jgi:hypothetical protein